MYVGVDPFQCVYLFRIAVSFLSLFFPFFFAFQFTEIGNTSVRAMCTGTRAQSVYRYEYEGHFNGCDEFCVHQTPKCHRKCAIYTHINPRKIERKIIHAQHVIIMEKKGIKRFCAKKHEQRAYNFISLDEFCVKMKCGSPVD